MTATYPTIRQAMDSADVAAYCDVSANTVKAWRRTNKLPEPAMLVAGIYPIWELKAIKAFHEARRPPGRPRGS